MWGGGARGEDETKKTHNNSTPTDTVHFSAALPVRVPTPETRSFRGIQRGSLLIVVVITTYLPSAASPAGPLPVAAVHSAAAAHTLLRCYDCPQPYGPLSRPSLGAARERVRMKNSEKQ